jgi:beta-lactamase regulating signal transducer with metallopeptidase domain
MTAPIDGINRVTEVWWFWVLQAGWQSAVVGFVLLAAVAWGRRWPAPVRYWLLVIALLKFAVPPLWSAPTGFFSYLAVNERLAKAAPDESVANAFLAADSQKQQATTAERVENPAKSSDVRLGKSSATRAPETAMSAAPPPTSSFRFEPGLMWKRLLLAIHVLGTISVLAWVAVQFGSVRRIIARSRSIACGPIADSVRRVSDLLALKRAPNVLLSPDVGTPLAAGIFRPTIVLPEFAERLLPCELDTVLVHELTHLRRGDAWIAWAQVLLCAVWWFDPVIWLTNRALRRVREDCCDDVILLSGVATESEYCDTLLRVARDSSVGHHSDLLACHMAYRLHPLGNRIRRILDPRVRRSLRMSVTATAALAIVACVALPGLGRSSAITASLRLVEASAEGTATTQVDSDPRGKPVRDSIEQGRKFLASAQHDSDAWGNQVRNSIEEGRNFLAGAQQEDGTFSSGAYKTGMTALAILALLKSGMKTDDRVISNGLRVLKTAPRPGGTYEASLVLAALVAARRQDPDVSQLAALVQMLEASQTAAGANGGMWNYGHGPMGGGSEDNSNTGIAVMGLEAAAAAGVPVKRETWRLTADHFVKFQNGDGGWGYHNGGPSTGSMTCNAISSLLICERMLKLTVKPAEVSGSLMPPDERAAASDRAVRRGIEWLARYFAVGTNPGQGSNWTLYYLYQMERVGRLSGRRIVGRHDWYRAGASFLVAGQSHRDGSWQAQGPEADKCLATSFVLLFLSENSFPPAIERRKN